MPGWGDSWGDDWGNPPVNVTVSVSTLELSLDLLAPTITTAINVTAAVETLELNLDLLAPTVTAQSVVTARRKNVSLEFNKLLNEYETKALVYSSFKDKSDGYDSYRQNYTFTELNPKTIECYIRQLSSESLVFRKYGLKNTGAIELTTKSKYKDLFKTAKRIKVNGNVYEVFKSSVGQYASIRNLPYERIAVVLERKSGNEITLPIVPTDRLEYIRTIIKEFGKRVLVYFSFQTKTDGYDSYRDNKTETNLNSKTLKAYVSSLRSMSSILAEYGLKETGSLQIITDAKYRNYFEHSNKILIDSEEYQVFRESTGGNSLIQSLPKNLIRVILERK